MSSASPFPNREKRVSAQRVRFLESLRKEPSSPAKLTLRKGRPFSFPNEEVHRAAWEADPELYALSLVASGVSPVERSRGLFVLLASSWASLSEPVLSPLSTQGDARKTIARVARLLLASMPAEDALTVFLALRRARANHKHTARTIVRYLTEHPCALELVASRRSAVRDALEHALGRRVTSAVVRSALEPGALVPIPYARSSGRARAVLALAFGEPRVRTGIAATLAATSTPKATHEPYFNVLGDGSSRGAVPKTVTATNRGDIAATLVHIYRGGSTAELREAYERFVARAAARLPHLDAKVAILLDASASMRGYGEREHCSIAQSVALVAVLARVCSKPLVFRVGGATSDIADGIPFPSGPTDLASTLIDAASCAPDVIAIVTDGYENSRRGDLAQVAQALPRAMGGVEIPIVVCQSQFTHKDDLHLRSIPSLQEVGFWHEDDLGDVLFALAARMSPHTASTYMRHALEARLSGLEKEALPWTSAP